MGAKAAEDAAEVVNVVIALTVRIVLKVNTLGVMTQATAQAERPIIRSATRLAIWLAVQQRAPLATTPWWLRAVLQLLVPQWLWAQMLS